MAQLRYKEAVTDNLVEAEDLCKGLGRSIQKGNADPRAALDTLATILKKVQKAKYLIDRD